MVTVDVHCEIEDLILASVTFETFTDQKRACIVQRQYELEEILHRSSPVLIVSYLDETRFDLIIMMI